MEIFIRRFISIILILTTFIFIFTQVTFAASSTAVLSKGMQGHEVESLQLNLKKLGYLKTEATGYFGEATEDAVKSFQKNHGISADGVAGTNTNNKIEMFLGKPYLKKGMNGKSVTEVQNALKKLKYFVQEATGYFGEATEAAVRDFQKHNGITATGIVGVLTYVEIDTLLNKTGTSAIVIDPGHGGIDVGASKGKVEESSVNLEISKKLRDYAADARFNVKMTRSKDISLDYLSKISGTRELKDLNARTEIINSSKAVMFVSIHVNSCPDSTLPSGSIVFYNDKLPGSKTLAGNIQSALNKVYTGSFKRDTHNSQTADFYVLRNSNIPGVLVETAYITNSQERTLLLTDSFQNKIAKAILTGIEKTSKTGW